MPPKPVNKDDLEQAGFQFDTNYTYLCNAIVNFNRIGVDKQSAAVINGRIRLLANYWDKCQEAAMTIESKSTAEEREVLPYYKDNLLEAAQQFFLEAYDFFQEKLEANQTTSQAMTTATIPTGVSPSSELRLPTIKMPSFSGNITDWLPFRDLFVALITNRSTLSNVEKLQYLLSSVSGDAAKLISHLSLTNDNFHVAWKALTDCYENERVIMDAYFARLHSIPPVNSNTALIGLKQLRADSSAALNALRALKCPVDQWNALLVYNLVQKLDRSSRKEWEVTIGSDKTYPQMDRLNAFLDTRIRSLEAISESSCAEVSNNPNMNVSSKQCGKRSNASTHKTNNVARSHHSATANPCVLCSSSHRLMQCEKFRAFNPFEKTTYVQENDLCRNCLSKGHHVAKCRSSFSCSICKSRHHTLLHDTNNASTNSTNSIGNDPPMDTHAHVSVAANPVLLATARVVVEAENQRIAKVRALVDQGSDATFVTTRLAQRLRSRLKKTRVKVSGIGGSQAGDIRNFITINVRSNFSHHPAIPTDALVVPKISSYAPVPFNVNDFPLISGLALADDKPDSNDEFDLLIGSDLYGSILLGGIVKGQTKSLVAQETIFGWLLSGPLKHQKDSPRIHVHHVMSTNLDFELRRFWELEEIPSNGVASKDEERCEIHFKNTHSRDITGRYTVRYPFKSGPPIDIGESKAIAMRSFLRLENRLAKSRAEYIQYCDFLREYETQGHMQTVENIDVFDQPTYLPHHPIIREDHCTTKLRVVFNASAKTTNQTSLNDHLLVGPKLQADLPALILNWRSYKYAFCADIQQMFRQILIHPDDRQYQLILWRSSPKQEVTTYALNTVTYGTASAPYLAQRVIKQLASDESSRFPLAKEILENEIYVDDVISGAHDEDTAVQKRDQLISCLSRGGITIRKWASNSPVILKDIDPSNHGLAAQKPFHEGEHLKILGIRWIPCLDVFSFHANPEISLEDVTKRKILSTTARIFDPLGWLSPVTVVMKILLQKLWKLSVDWDEPLSGEIVPEWIKFGQQLSCLTRLRIPRWSYQDKSIQGLQIHGFADASLAAYSAAVYLRVQAMDGTIRVTLLLAKTKVAPVKTISVPRLELCAANLLVRCLVFVLDSMKLRDVPVFGWSDSTIVLAWIAKIPSDLKVFVGNRVASIQNKLPQVQWNHVPSEENPTDCASRGIEPIQLINHSLWWDGPLWLRWNSTRWPTRSLTDLHNVDLELRRNASSHAHHQHSHAQWSLPNDISSWTRLLRVTAYVIRFVLCARCNRPGDGHIYPRREASE